MATVDSFLPDFIQSTFFSGYTIFNTVVYTLILLIFIIAIIKMFKKIEIDPLSILYSITPFIICGCLVRALVDHGIYPKTIFLITPGIYILIGLATIISLLFSIYLYKIKKIDYRYTLFIIGLILIVPNLFFIPRLNIKPVIYIFITWIIVFLILYVLFYITKNLTKERHPNLEKFLSNQTNFMILSAHLFDASTTFVATEYFNYCEQHVLPNALYQVFDTYLTIFPMKIIVILLVLYIIDQYFDDETIKSLLKLSVFVLGLAPGMRNFLTMVMASLI